MDQPALYAPRLTPDQLLARNAPYVNPRVTNGYNTPLAPMEEAMFRGWVQNNKVPFQPDAPKSDYDMRGFYRGLMSGDPKAQQAVDPNDSRMHYPDYWKTPYHETFSNQSQWALPSAPQWTNEDKLISHGAQVQFDDKAPRGFQ